MNKNQIIERESRFGKQIMVGDLRITPQSEVVEVKQQPFHLIWNRPTAILVERGEQMRRIPIVDVTRITLLGLFAFSGIFSLLTMIISLKKRKIQNDTTNR